MCYKIAPFDDVYLFVNNKVPSRSKRSAERHTEKLKSHESVSGFEFVRKLGQGVCHNFIIDFNFKIRWAEQQVSKRRVKRGYIPLENFEEKAQKRAENLAYRSSKYDDPEWQHQWYLVRINIIN